MSKSEHAQAAAGIRKIIKTLTGLKAKVRSEIYSGGSSVWASILNPTKEELEAIEKATACYQMGHFDGMIDLYEYSNPQNCAQVKFVFIEAEYSDSVLQAAWDFAKDKLPESEDAPASHKDAWRWNHEGDNGYMWILKTINGRFGEGFKFK